MMDMGTILGAVGNVASGGILGLVGTGIHAWLKAREQKQKLEHEREQARIRLEEMKLEHQQRLEEIKAQGEADANKAAIEAQAAEARAEAEVRAASYRLDKATYGGGLVDAIRGLMRPAITLYTLGLMTAIGWLLYRAQGIPAEMAGPLWTQIVQTVVFLATTCVTWWFGSRVHQAK